MRLVLTIGDKSVVSNLRQQDKKKVLEKFSDVTLANAWLEFSLSDEYPDMEKFPSWCEMVDEEYAKYLKAKATEPY